MKKALILFLPLLASCGVLRQGHRGQSKAPIPLPQVSSPKEVAGTAKVKPGSESQAAQKAKFEKELEKGLAAIRATLHAGPSAPGLESQKEAASPSSGNASSRGSGFFPSP